MAARLDLLDVGGLLDGVALPRKEVLRQRVENVRTKHLVLHYFTWAQDSKHFPFEIRDSPFSGLVHFTMGMSM